MEFYLTNTEYFKNEDIRKIYDLSDFELKHEEIPNSSSCNVKIKINSLSELLKLIEKTDKEIIISQGSHGYEIEIYDGYRE